MNTRHFDSFCLTFLASSSKNSLPCITQSFFLLHNKKHFFPHFRTELCVSETIKKKKARFLYYLAYFTMVVIESHILTTDKCILTSPLTTNVFKYYTVLCPLVCSAVVQTCPCSKFSHTLPLHISNIWGLKLNLLTVICTCSFLYGILWPGQNCTHLKTPLDPTLFYFIRPSSCAISKYLSFFNRS